MYNPHEALCLSIFFPYAFYIQWIIAVGLGKYVILPTLCYYLQSLVLCIDEHKA